jgi:uncharacterized protein YlxW (UPF0749 family)
MVEVDGAGISKLQSTQHAPSLCPQDCACCSSQAHQRGWVLAGAVAAAREAEQVDAARREAHIEQLQRVRAEAAAGQLQEEAERLRARLKASQLELKQLQEASQSSSRSASDHASVKVCAGAAGPSAALMVWLCVVA